MKEKQKHIWMYVFIGLLVVTAAALVAYFVLRSATYERIEVVKSYESKGTHNGKYINYEDGLLEYSRDGIAKLTMEGKEIWNQPCQMGNPIAETCEKAAVVADKGGTNIYVFHKDGLRGEIQTTRPIERVCVSAQGIVAVILQDETSPRIMCYDAKGNPLVELKTSLSTTGYPIAIDLSQDGKVLLVSYLLGNGASVSTNIVYYYFDDANIKKEEYEVASKKYGNTVIPTVSFIDKDASLLISDQSLIVYEGLESPKEKLVVPIEKEIQSVAYNEKHVALVLKNPGNTTHELCMYRINGKKLMSAEIEGEYDNIKVEKGQIVLYDENKCAIYNNAGVCKFEGLLEANIVGISPAFGLNKYIVISTNGFQKMQLVK